MDAPDLNQLLNLDKGAYVAKDESKSARLEAIREAACSLGARGGLSRRSKEIQLHLEQNARELDPIYSFQSIMLEYGVLPPVITKSENLVKQESERSITYAGTVYRMESDAKFVNVAPTWRTYLFKGLDSGPVEPPPEVFFPENDTERKEWKREVSRCWKLGVDQANETLTYNRAELKRDFKGMILFKLMALRGDVEVPVIVTKQTPVDSISNKERQVDKRTYVIRKGGSL